MSTEIRLDIDNDPRADIKVDAPDRQLNGERVIRIQIHHGADNTFIWLTPDQARIIRGGIGVALDVILGGTS